MRTALIRSPARAVGLEPPARECEARLRGRERNNYSKTITLCCGMLWDGSTRNGAGVAGKPSTFQPSTF